jgi:predicted nucleic acid-binding protein
VSILLDTNILTRLAQPSHPHHAAASAAVLSLQHRREDLRIAPQNLYEFWVVATRPVAANGGLGMPAPTAKAMLDHFEALFSPLADPPDLYARWKALVATHATVGKAAHDARLVAAMQAHGIGQILTFNGADFSRYPAVTPLDPASVTAGATGTP